MKSNLLFIAAIALMVGCAKDGAQGPAGANGSNGLNGSAGATGATGATGANGTANIKTNIYPVTSSGWTTISAGASYKVVFADANISDADSDAVSVAVGSAANGPWLEIPTINIVNSGDQMVFGYQNNQASVIYLYTSAPSSTLYFKVTVIPPALIKKRSFGGQFLQN